MFFILEPAPKPVVAPVGLETALKQVGATQLFRSNSEVSKSSILWGLYYSLTLIVGRPPRKTCSHVWPIVSHCHQNLLPWNLKRLFLSFQRRKWWRRTKLKFGILPKFCLGVWRKYLHFFFCNYCRTTFAKWLKRKRLNHSRRARPGEIFHFSLASCHWKSRLRLWKVYLGIFRWQFRGKIHLLTSFSFD